MTTGAELVRDLVSGDAVDLPAPHRVDMDEAVEVYRSAQRVEQAAWFVMGYAASCVETTYGEASLEQFARKVGETVPTLDNRRRVYRRIMGLEKSIRIGFLQAVYDEVLSYSHFVVTNGISDDEQYAEVLTDAVKNNYSVRTTAELAAQRRGLSPAPETLEEDGERDEAIYEGAQEVEARARACPHCGGEGVIYELDY